MPLSLALACAASPSLAQVENSGAQAIVLNATLAESLTVNLSANAVNFNLTAGAALNPGSTSLTATTAWVLRPGRAAVRVFAYFRSANAALSDGAGNNIPSSAFQISDNGGLSRALTNALAFVAANAGLQLANVLITSANRSGNRVDVMSFNIDLSAGTLPQLPAGVYTGTLNIRAQATL